MGEIKVTQAVKRDHRDELPHPELIDERIESREYRKSFRADEGVFCVTVGAGEVLGELRLNVQFEGPIGDYDFCMAQQNDALLRVSEWLRDFLCDELQGDFDVDLQGLPCPKGKIELRLDLAARIVRGLDRAELRDDDLVRKEGHQELRQNERQLGRGPAGA